MFRDLNNKNQLKETQHSDAASTPLHVTTHKILSMSIDNIVLNNNVAVWYHHLFIGTLLVFVTRFRYSIFKIDAIDIPAALTDVVLSKIT